MTQHRVAALAAIAAARAALEAAEACLEAANDRAPTTASPEFVDCVSCVLLGIDAAAFGALRRRAARDGIATVMLGRRAAIETAPFLDWLKARKHTRRGPAPRAAAADDDRGLLEQAGVRLGGRGQ